MLEVGIVGKKYSELYISAINSCDDLKLVGVFDPSFQFEFPKNIRSELVYSSFEELLKKSDSIIFASSEKIYLPLIEMAIKHTRSLFLHSIHNISYSEQVQLLKLTEEAGIVLQIQQPIIFNEIFESFFKLSNKPLLLNYIYTNSLETNLLHKTRSIVSAALTLFKSQLRKVAVNVISTFSELPDVIKIRLDFDNGSVLEIMINSIGEQKSHHIKCYEYNKYFEVDLIENTLIGKKENQNISITAKSINNTFQKIIIKQLNNFYFNVADYSLPTNSIENEIVTQKVIEMVKEKLRISINVC